MEVHMYFLDVHDRLLSMEIQNDTVHRTVLYGYASRPRLEHSGAGAYSCRAGANPGQVPVRVGALELFG